MRALVLLGIAAGLLCGSSTLTTPANAAGTTAYVSRTGSGSACTHSAPCNSMPTAVTAAGAGGEVICLDRGNFGAGGITFSITISCGDGLWEASGVIIGISPPAGAGVVIEGLVADTQGAAGSIVIINGQGSVHLRRVQIGNNVGANNHFAIDFQPTGPAKLFVTDSFIYNFGASGISGAILLRPAAGVTANVTIERSRFQNNRFGIIADGNPGGIIRGVVRDSTISGSANNGITVSAPSSNVVLSIDSCTISGNGFGLVATGSNAGMLVGRSVISTNNTGLFTNTGGALLSYGNNSVNANSAGETFTGATGLK